MCKSEMKPRVEPYSLGNLHVHLANAAQGDIVVTMEPSPKLGGIPATHGRMGDGRRARVSATSFCPASHVPKFTNFDRA